MGTGHPERPARLAALTQYLDECGLMADLDVVDAPQASAADIERVHPADYIAALEGVSPAQGLVHISPDTAMCPQSLAAARTSVGAALTGVDLVLTTDAQRVFCAVRPPGHHAEESTAMGFCFFNGVAVAAKHALARIDVERVAILDFDVHHGNGTVDAFMEDQDVLVCSSFQYPHYPYRLQDVDRPNIVNTPLSAGSKGVDFRLAIERDWAPALDEFKPDLVLVSAGFDAHADDPLGDLLLTEDDFAWVTDFIVDAANRHADGRIVSVLEGGYDLAALGRSVAAHLERLLA